MDIEELDSGTTNNWTRRFSTPQLELSSTESVINDGEYMSAAYLEYLSKPIQTAKTPKLVTVTKNKRMDSQKVQQQQYGVKNIPLRDEMSEGYSKVKGKLEKRMQTAILGKLILLTTLNTIHLLHYIHL